MRREIFRMSRDQAEALLMRAPVVHLATTTPDGAPVLRTVHGVVMLDDPAGPSVAFHGAPAGEKADCIGRACVLAAEEIVAPIPSYFVDPERACPATTLYQSVQVHGRLDEVSDPVAKAAVLAALMKRYQPEGGHTPIDAEHPHYRAAVRGILIVRVSLAQLDGKAKLGQNRKLHEITILLEKLWQRGLPGDAHAIDLVRAANPDAPLPDCLKNQGPRSQRPGGP